MTDTTPPNPPKRRKLPPRSRGHVAPEIPPDPGRIARARRFAREFIAHLAEAFSVEVCVLCALYMAQASGASMLAAILIRK